MNTDRRVSVVLIFLNAQEFIREAIESVLAQTYSDWELLLVDDGSTDASTTIALDYVSRLQSKARYLEHNGHQNQGMSASRNLGINDAGGRYIALLDSDDVWLPTKLAEQVAVLDSLPHAAMVYGPSLKWYSWAGNDQDMQRDVIKRLRIQPNTIVIPPTLLTAFLNSEVATPCPSSMIFRRELADAVGGFEESFRGIYQLYEDQAFLAKVHLAHSVFVSDRCLDKYRQHQNSCVTVVKAAGHADAVRRYYLNWLERYLDKEGYKGTEVWRALQGTLWAQRHPVIHRNLMRVRHLGRRISGKA